MAAEQHLDPYGDGRKEPFPRPPALRIEIDGSDVRKKIRQYKLLFLNYFMGSLSPGAHTVANC